MSDRMPSAGDFQERIVRRAARDDAFRQRLLAAPKATIEQELGLSLPASLEFVALEETDSRLYLVLPARSLDPGELRGDGPNRQVWPPRGPVRYVIVEDPAGKAHRLEKLMNVGAAMPSLF